MALTLITWNTQGAGNIQYNNQQLGMADIVVLQEAGMGLGMNEATPTDANSMISLIEDKNPQSRRTQELFNRYHLIAGGDLTYDNSRCSLLTLTKMEGICEEVVTGEKRNILQVTIQGSSGDSLRIGNIHSDAIGDSTLHYTTLLGAVWSFSSGTSPWILAGDFNCNPGHLIRNSEWCYAAPNTSTHLGGKIYDYIIYSNDIVVTGIDEGDLKGSDHRPIKFTLDLQANI
jgi:endonuclease/exonuclease/phosphatase family metal-dependent hydrolase